MKLPNLTPEQIVGIVRGAGHNVYTRGDFNLNIIGLRRTPGVPDAFDDVLVDLYRVGGSWVADLYPCTTDPGAYWLYNPSRVEGTAILQPGHYPHCWTLGKHKGEYPALVQAPDAGFRVWRDRNRDGTPDHAGPTYTDVVGLNNHHAGTSSTVVGKWSAGCQVVARQADWDRHWATVQKAAAIWGPTFSYTLVDWAGEGA